MTNEPKGIPGATFIPVVVAIWFLLILIVGSALDFAERARLLK